MFPLYVINPTGRTAWITYAIIAANTALLLWSLTLGPGDYEKITAHYGFIPARIAQLRDPRLVVQVPVGVAVVRVPPFGQLREVPQVANLSADRAEIYSSLLTCMFLHAGWAHLLGNMWFLLIFGKNIEDRLGHIPYLIFYLVGGLAASAVHWASGPGSTAPVIGASGAIAAVLGAYAVTFPTARVVTVVFLLVYFTVIELPALVVLGLWFIMQLFDGVSGLRIHLSGGVAFWAHVGGFDAGAAMMEFISQLLPPISAEPEPAADTDTTPW